MAKAAGQLWLKQARSDLAAAKRYDSSEPEMYCHAISKFQQVVEKSIKGLVATLRDKGDVNAEPTMRYDLEPELRVLAFMDLKPHNGETYGEVSKLMSNQNRKDMLAICKLAPQKPEGDALHARNTEYPYQLPPGGVWIAPCDARAFSAREFQEYARLANYVYERTSRIVRGLLAIETF